MRLCNPSFLIIIKENLNVNGKSPDPPAAEKESCTAMNPHINLQDNALSPGLHRPAQGLGRIIYRTVFHFSLLLIIVSLCITLYYDITWQRQSRDQFITASAAFLAQSPSVISMLESGYPDPRVNAELDIFASSMPDVSTIVIYNTGGLRFYHTDRHQTGETYLDGDEDGVLSGSAPYITTGYDTYGAQRRAYHAIRNAQDDIIGFIMLSVPQAVISAGDRNILLVHFLVLCSMLLVSSLLTGVIVGHIRNALQGHDPDELMQLYTGQDTVINALSEGLVATDRQGHVLYANRIAQALVSGGEGLRGQYIGDVFPSTEFSAVMETGKPAGHRTMDIGDHTVLINEIPLLPAPGALGRLRTEPSGILMILQDRTETLRLSDELSGAKSMMDTLRAFNHEFLNKLHIILGYLQIGDTQKAMEFITNATLVSSQSIRKTANSIRVSRLCALVIGKMMHAAELGISLQVTPDSMVLEQDMLISQDDCCTIVGNLLENAIDELRDADTEVREILLGLYFRHDTNIITCEDTGRGIAPEILSRIFVRGVTTKGNGHGTGMATVHETTENNHGTIEIETEPGEGTCFTVTFSLER